MPLTSFLRKPLPLLAALLLSGCAGPTLQDYANRKPPLDLEQFFSGPLTAEGVVRDRHGKVIRTFTAQLQGQWDDQHHGTLRERFVYDDGEQSSRTWTFTPHANGPGYRASAGDVVEPGIWRAQGNAAHMKYILRIPYRGDTLDVAMDDWMFAVTPNRIINQTQMSKWGFSVGEVVLVIDRGGQQ